jgi:hypothetical protein
MPHHFRFFRFFTSSNLSWFDYNFYHSKIFSKNLAPPKKFLDPTLCMCVYIYVFVCVCVGRGKGGGG